MDQGLFSEKVMMGTSVMAKVSWDWKVAKIRDVSSVHDKKGHDIWEH